ncbi:MAG TPA: EVE domain-containing protein [Terriglobia bacterium]|nr:EVE domain-containing protein [Terriglobia bacterium]
MKSDPETYSFADLERDGQTRWDGISNNLALKHLRSAHKGDAVLVYETGEAKAVVGLAEVASEPYPDPKQKDLRLVVVDLKAGRRLSRPVTLSELKQQASLKDFYLVRMPRLSVMPVTDAQWKTILDLARS